MKENRKYLPPKWATQLLRWYCKPSLLEDLEGDLNEYFQRNVKSDGVRKAKLIYIIDVFKFFRLYTVRKPEFINLLINFIMIGSYIKTAGRSIVRNKLFSFINIFGLAVSMSLGLVLIAVLSEVLSYDKFHENHKRIYRVISRYEYLGDKSNNFMAATSLKCGKLIEQQFSGVEKMAIISQNYNRDFTWKEKTVPIRGYFANNGFFDVFSFKLIMGNRADALTKPHSIVLTERSAKKIFGEEDPLNKIIEVGKEQFTVTGVVQDIPYFSHFKFESLCSLNTNEKENTKSSWDDVWSTYVYLLLPKNADLKNLKTNLDRLSVREDKTVKNTHIELDLQPLDDIMFRDDMGNQIGPVLGKTLMWVFGGLTFIVILSACFNYTNLSIARALRRTHEVGVRKVIGAMSGHVISQFMVEAIIISLCSLVLAVLGFSILKPHFLNIEPEIQKMFKLQISIQIVLCFIGFAIIVGFAAGIFPSLFFAKVKAISVLKSTFSVGGTKKINGRKVLTVIQYCISIILVSSSIGVYRQYHHYLNFDLGFSTENILNIELHGNKPEILRKELGEISEVKEISESMLVTSIGNFWSTDIKYHGSPNDSSWAGFNRIDENYIPLHGHNLLAGKNFTPKPDSAKETEVIVNQEVLKRFNIANQDPQKAIGDVLKVNGKDMTIIGVIKDFQYSRANNQTSKEILFRYSKQKIYWLNVKIESQDLIATHAKMEAIWKKIDPVHPFEAHFYNEQIEEAFAGLSATVKLAGFLAFLAICIASMGLLGMVVFTTETRLKEISIRKVMGASETALVYLLGKGFFVLLGMSVIISLPITILFFEKIAFPQLANHAPLSLIEMFLGVLGILLVAALMIGSQTLKVARTNPAEVLKNE